MNNIGFADDTTVVGLITDGDESVYRREAEQLESWFSHRHLLLSTQKTVEMVVDFRHNPSPLPFLPASTSVALLFPL